MTDHERHTDDVGAYLLGALNDLERHAFERHLRDCDECREELERLRPAAEALPGSVKQLEPPPGLKRRLMAEVEPPRRMPSRNLLAVAAAVVIALAVAFGVSQLGGEDTRTVTATVAEVMPGAGGQLDIKGDEATLRLHDMPDLGRARVYQVWLQHGDRMVPARTFEVGRSGMGDVRLPDVRNTDGVFVTREDRGGARVPSEDPIVSVPL
ncbi:MAG TPA: anti-sigma factor [Thermoleophilaceae bacterium]|nr:anti-sigma factor [Thermoleophilaceae bacterium]